MLLRSLMENVGRVQTRNTLETRLYSWGEEVASNALEVHIHNLRKKLGADFIKTSTGKVAINATPEAAEIMLQAIKDSGRAVGFKAAGGVRNVADAERYLSLAAQILGADWVTPKTFRFGASSLLASLLQTLGHAPAAQNNGEAVSQANSDRPY